MALHLLKKLFDEGLPATVSDKFEVAAIRGLVDAKFIRADFVHQPDGTVVAQVNEITGYGRTVLKATRPGSPRIVQPPAID